MIEPPAGHSMAARGRSTRSAVAVLVGVGLTLGACTSSDSPSSDTAPSSSSETTASPDWARVDRALSRLGPEVSFLAARVSDEGTCRPIHDLASDTARPTASQFKLFVLGALAERVVDGQVSWDQTLTVEDDDRSLGNSQGSLQFAASGSSVPVEEAAMKMISISDNTAADMLIDLVGRDDVEQQMRQWAEENASANEPFLTTKQMFLLHYSAGLGDRYLDTPRGERARFLESSVDPLPMGEIASGYSSDPRYIDKIEWFASPQDVCRAFAGLHDLSTDPALSPTLSTILSHEVGGIGLDPSVWPTVWFKGGSEAGVLTLGWLATNSDGETFVVEAMVSNPDAALADDSITDLVALAKQAFGVIEAS